MIKIKNPFSVDSKPKTNLTLKSCFLKMWNNDAEGDISLDIYVIKNIDFRKATWSNANIYTNPDLIIDKTYFSVSPIWIKGD